MNSHKISIPLALIAIGAAAIFNSCGKKNGADGQSVAASDSIAVAQVTVEKVTLENVAQITEYTATVEADKTNNISSASPNRIKSILVDVGSKVAKGQKVAVLDDVNIEQARIRIENLQRQYDRALNLFNIGGGTRQAVDDIKTELDANRRQYDNLVENTILRSPIAGVVTARNYDPGDMTGALPVVTVEQINPVKIILNVSESDFSHVKQGMTAQVALDSHPDATFTGRIELVHPKIDASTRTFPIEVTVANPKGEILPGMFARVTLNYGEAQHVVVPDRAIVKQSGSGNRYVYVYNPANETVTYNKVEIGRRLGDRYEIVNGIEPGADVVVSGQTRLTDGIKVAIK